jgi:hypothetical protein
MYTHVSKCKNDKKKKRKRRAWNEAMEVPLDLTGSRKLLTEWTKGHTPLRN